MDTSYAGAGEAKGVTGVATPASVAGAKTSSAKSAAVDVAVCIITHNSREDLAVCLQRLYSNWPDGLSLHVTVVDNTNADGSSDYVRAHWPQVRLITNNTRLGFGANANQAAAGPAARYLLVMNPDVELEAGAVATLVDYMDVRPEVGACGPKTLYPDGRLQATSRQFPNWITVFWRWLKLDRIWQPEFYRRFLMLDWDHNNAQPVDWLMASCLLIRADAFAAVQGFDTGFFLYYEDIDLCRRLWQAGYSVHYVPEAVVVHKYQRHSARGLLNNLTLIHLQSILHYQGKHGLAFGQLQSRHLTFWITLLLVFGDLVLTELALQIGRYARLWFPLLGAFPYPVPSPLHPVIYMIVPVIWFGVFALLGLYDVRRLRNLKRELARLLIGVLLAGLVFAGVLYALFLYQVYVPRLLLAYFLTANWLLLASERAILRYLLGRNGLFYQPRTLVIGSGKLSRELVASLSRDVHAEFNFIGVHGWDELAPGQEPQVQLAQLAETVHFLQIDEVIFVQPLPAWVQWADLARALAAQPITLRMVVDLGTAGMDAARTGAAGPKRMTVETLYGIPTLAIRTPAAAAPGGSLLRRLVDFIQP
jgi:N-acetylglucosaminyl-diphospho-decaprenol L-rhamnosyltransferase